MTWMIVFYALGGCSRVQQQISMSEPEENTPASQRLSTMAVNPMVWPLSGTAAPSTYETVPNDVFGPRLSSSIYDFHQGLDFVAPEGTPVFAVADGTVVRLETEAQTAGTSLSRYGNWVLIKHDSLYQGQTYYTAYLHLKSYAVVFGQHVNAGTAIGQVGKTGANINLFHLHLHAYANLSQSADKTKTFVSGSKIRNPYRLLPLNQQNLAQASYSVNNGMIEWTVILPVSEADLGHVEMNGTLSSRIIDFDTLQGLNANNVDQSLVNSVEMVPEAYTQYAPEYRLHFKVPVSVLGSPVSLLVLDTRGTVIAQLDATVPPQTLNGLPIQQQSLCSWINNHAATWIQQFPVASETYMVPDMAMFNAVKNAVAQWNTDHNDAALASALNPLSFGVYYLQDINGELWLMVEDQGIRGWGAMALNKNALTSTLYEAPHCMSDYKSEEIAARAATAHKAAAVIFSGSDRDANAQASLTQPSFKISDMAHNTGTIFEAFHEGLQAPLNLQIHGFSKQNYSGFANAVISDGDGTQQPNVTMTDIANRLATYGYSSGFYQYGNMYEPLGARNNVQGQFTRSLGLQFVHIELDTPLRNQDINRLNVAQAIY